MKITLNDIKNSKNSFEKEGKIVVNGVELKHEIVTRHETYTSCSLPEYEIYDSHLKLQYVMGVGWALINPDNHNRVEMSLKKFYGIEEIKPKKAESHKYKVGDKVIIDGEELTIKQIGGLFEDEDYGDEYDEEFGEKGKMYKAVVLFENTNKFISISELREMEVAL